MHARGQCTWVGAIPGKYRLGRERIESSLEEDSGAVCRDAQPVLAMCTFSPESQLYLGLHHRKRGQQVKEPILLLWDPTRRLCSDLGSPTKGHQTVGGSPEEDREDDQKAGGLLL